MIKLLGGLVGIVGVFWLALAGGYAVWWWDRAPERPAWTQAHFLFLAWPHFIRDPSLFAQGRVFAVQLTQCQANEAELRSSIVAQNRSIDLLSAAGRDAIARQERAIVEAMASKDDAVRLQRTIAALPPATPADDCPALDLSDQVFVGYLRGSR